MLLKLDKRYPELFNANTRLADLDRRASWGIVTTDPVTQCKVRGWFGQYGGGSKQVWLSVFPDAIDFTIVNKPRDKTKLEVRHLFSIIQKVFWDFRYRSWAIEAMSRITGNRYWHDDTPPEVRDLRDVPTIAPTHTPTKIRL